MVTIKKSAPAPQPVEEEIEEEIQEEVEEEDQGEEVSEETEEVADGPVKKKSRQHDLIKLANRIYRLVGTTNVDSVNLGNVFNFVQSMRSHDEQNPTE